MFCFPFSSELPACFPLLLAGYRSAQNPPKTGALPMFQIFLPCLSLMLPFFFRSVLEFLFPSLTCCLAPRLFYLARGSFQPVSLFFPPPSHSLFWARVTLPWLAFSPSSEFFFFFLSFGCEVRANASASFTLRGGPTPSGV